MPDETYVMLGVGDPSLYEIKGLTSGNGCELVRVEFNEYGRVLIEPTQL